MTAAYVAGSVAYYLQNYSRPAKGAVKTTITQVTTVTPNSVQAKPFIPNRSPLPTVASPAGAQSQIPV